MYEHGDLYSWYIKSIIYKTKIKKCPSNVTRTYTYFYRTFNNILRNFAHERIFRPLTEKKAHLH